LGNGTHTVTLMWLLRTCVLPNQCRKNAEGYNTVYGRHTSHTYFIKHSRSTVIGYRRQAVPMGKGKIRPAVTFTPWTDRY